MSASTDDTVKIDDSSEQDSDGTETTDQNPAEEPKSRLDVASGGNDSPDADDIRKASPEGEHEENSDTEENDSDTSLEVKYSMGNCRSKKEKAHTRKYQDKKKSKPYHWNLRRHWSEKDTEMYRKGYPGKRDDLGANENLEFYINKKCSRPDGDYIDDIHDKWWGDYELLERHHGYIQWLFPIRESGMNWHAQELQLHEAKGIIADKKAHERVMKSYEMMLDFYGMKLKDRKTGHIKRAENWKARFAHLNRSVHNYLRITRILKSLGEFDFEYLKTPFVQFVLEEALKSGYLDRTLDSCSNYWIETIKDDDERQKLRKYVKENS